MNKFLNILSLSPSDYEIINIKKNKNARSFIMSIKQRSSALETEKLKDFNTFPSLEDHALEACFKPWINFVNLQTKESSLSFSNPGGCCIYRSVSSSLLRKALPTSSCLMVQELAKAMERTDLITGLNVYV